MKALDYQQQTPAYFLAYFLYTWLSPSIWQFSIKKRWNVFTVSTSECKNHQACSSKSMLILSSATSKMHLNSFWQQTSFLVYFVKGLRLAQAEINFCNLKPWKLIDVLPPETYTHQVCQLNWKLYHLKTTNSLLEARDIKTRKPCFCLYSTNSI